MSSLGCDKTLYFLQYFNGFHCLLASILHVFECLHFVVYISKFYVTQTLFHFKSSVFSLPLNFCSVNLIIIFFFTYICCYIALNAIIQTNIRLLRCPALSIKVNQNSKKNINERIKQRTCRSSGVQLKKKNHPFAYTVSNK